MVTAGTTDHTTEDITGLTGITVITDTIDQDTTGIIDLTGVDIIDPMEVDMVVQLAALEFQGCQGEFA